jgi:hypothetical protein
VVLFWRGWFYFSRHVSVLVLFLFDLFVFPHSRFRSSLFVCVSVCCGSGFRPLFCFFCRSGFGCLCLFGVGFRSSRHFKSVSFRGFLLFQSPPPPLRGWSVAFFCSYIWFVAFI